MKKFVDIEKIVEKFLSPFVRGKYKEFDLKISNELFRTFYMMQS